MPQCRRLGGRRLHLYIMQPAKPQVRSRCRSIGLKEGRESWRCLGEEHMKGEGWERFSSDSSLEFQGNSKQGDWSRDVPR